MRGERHRAYELDGAEGAEGLGGEELAAALGSCAPVAPACSAVQLATYYDTGRLELATRGVTVAERHGGKDAGWHLELSGASPEERAEYWLPLGARGQVPADLVAMLAGRIGGASLRPVARLRTRRETFELAGPGGSALARVADDRVVAVRVADARPGAWREVGVEARRGDTGCQDDIERRLLGLGATRSPYASPLARVLAAEGLKRTAPAGDPLAGRVARQVAELVRCETGVREGDGEAIHDMRVATRRLRALLRSFEVAYRAGSLDVLYGELAVLGGVLGAARDAGVLATRLEADLEAIPNVDVLGPVRAVLRAHGAREAASANRALLALLDSPRYVDLLDRLVAFAGAPPYAGPKRRVSFYRDQLRRERRRVERLVARVDKVPPGERDAALHAVRRAAKRARYAAETATPVLGSKARRAARQYAKVQEILGEHHDAVVARAYLRAEGARAGVRAGENGFTFGLLHAGEAARAAAAEATFRRRWRKIADRLR